MHLVSLGDGGPYPKILEPLREVFWQKISFGRTLLESLSDTAMDSVVVCHSSSDSVPVGTELHLLFMQLVVMHKSWSCLIIFQGDST